MGRIAFGTEENHILWTDWKVLTCTWSNSSWHVSVWEEEADSGKSAALCMKYSPTYVAYAKGADASLTAKDAGEILKYMPYRFKIARRGPDYYNLLRDARLEGPISLEATEFAIELIKEVWPTSPGTHLPMKPEDMERAVERIARKIPPMVTKESQRRADPDSRKVILNHKEWPYVRSNVMSRAVDAFRSMLIFMGAVQLTGKDALTKRLEFYEASRLSQDELQKSDYGAFNLMTNRRKTDVYSADLAMGDKAAEQAGLFWDWLNQIVFDITEAAYNKGFRDADNMLLRLAHGELNPFDYDRSVEHAKKTQEA
jgi:hypothetical protein